MLISVLNVAVENITNGLSGIANRTERPRSPVEFGGFLLSVLSM